jgi:undecaprenyl pyrophosphate phosphatase UppP
LRITTVIQPEDLNSLIPEMLTAFIVSLVGLWFLIRMILWYKMLKKDRDLDSSFSFEREGLFVDMVGLMLLASPVAWEHHYILAIPVLLWTFALQIKEKQSPIASLLAFLFIFGLPTFDVFPMSYLRLTGLLILLIKSDPIHYFRRNSKFEVANTASL